MSPDGAQLVKKVGYVQLSAVAGRGTTIVDK